MELESDYELLARASSIYSQQDVAYKLGHPREVLNRWLSEGDRRAKLNWLPHDKRKNLESMLPQQSNVSSDFTFIDLFAGIGGIRKGFESAGGKCVFTSEYDKYAVKTYSANHFCDHNVHGDIKSITQPENINESDVYDYVQEKIPDHDVLLAGFPCQPFSIAGVSKKNSLGRLHGFKDATQGTLFFDVAQIIDAKKPVAIMLENVKNLKNHDKGKTFKIIMKTLDELGYEVADANYDSSRPDPKIINAKKFVPQNRERIVLAAIRKEFGGTSGLTLSGIDKYYPDKSLAVGEILEPEDSVDEKYILSTKLWKYLKDYALKHKAAGNGFGFGLVKPEDLCTRTLSARYYKDGSEILIYRGSRQRPRRLTPRECARLMGFDLPRQSNFIIPVSDMQAYKQFGNSVVVPVFSAVAQTMKPFILKAKGNM